MARELQELTCKCSGERGICQTHLKCSQACITGSRDPIQDGVADGK